MKSCKFTWIVLFSFKEDLNLAIKSNRFFTRNVSYSHPSLLSPLSSPKLALVFPFPLELVCSDLQTDTPVCSLQPTLRLHHQTEPPTHSFTHVTAPNLYCFPGVYHNPTSCTHHAQSQQELFPSATLAYSVLAKHSLLPGTLISPHWSSFLPLLSLSKFYLFLKVPFKFHMLHEAVMGPAGNDPLTQFIPHLQSVHGTHLVLITYFRGCCVSVSAKFAKCWRQKPGLLVPFISYSAALRPTALSPVPYMAGAQWVFTVNDDVTRTLFLTPVQIKILPLRHCC